MLAERGFTLIELLTVIGILGVLAAVAIPQYADYRRRGIDARSVCDIRNAASAEEAYFVDYEHYANCVGGIPCQAALPGFKWSRNVQIGMQRVPEAGGTPEHFTGYAFHTGGTHYNMATAFLWDSNAGGMQE